jgi:DNA-binding SARP family transcriptional activator
VLNFEVLGPVTARDGAWTAELSRQLQLLLAVLVMKEGRPAPRDELEKILWADGKPPQRRGLPQVVSDLRAVLEPAVPGGQAVPPAVRDAYLLPSARQDSDVARFTAKMREARMIAGQARNRSGPARAAAERDSAEAMRAALGEWGDRATGLFGGQTLAGLPGDWAANQRTLLRGHYREARLTCLEQDLNDRQYERVAGDCENMADDPEALKEERFVVIWMTAAYRMGSRAGAAKAYRRAMAASRGDRAAFYPQSLHKLAKMIETDDPRLAEPGPRPRAVPGGDPKPANQQRSTVNDRQPQVVNFNNNGPNLTIGSQAGHVEHLEVHQDAVADETGATDVPAEEAAAEQAE